MVDNIPKGVKLKTEDSDMAENIPVELIQRGINNNVAYIMSRA